jgi:tubulin-specific chaperone E
MMKGSDDSIDRSQDLTGKRVLIDQELATIRFHGPLEGRPGLYYGVEWDNVSRGKHSGEYKGQSLFKVKIPNSATFISCARQVDLGTGFVQALKVKYTDAIEDSHITFGSSNIDVKTVGWDKVSKMLCNLYALKEAGLANYGISNSGGEPGEIASICPSIIDLDLSKNIFSSWKNVGSTVCELSNLHSLRLNYCRMSLIAPDDGAFNAVKVLTLSHSMVQFEELNQIMEWFPNLDELHVASNGIKAINITNMENWSRLKQLNLEYNNIAWDQVMNLSQLPSLQILNLNSNAITQLTKVQGFTSLTELKISENAINSWKCIDCLNSFPALLDIRVMNIPLTANMTRRDRHTALIARLSKITKLNGSTMTPKERMDCELYYLSQCALQTHTPEYIAEHPSYTLLCAKYGEPTKPVMRKAMLELRIVSETTTIEKKMSAKLTIRAAKTMVARLLYPTKWQSCLGGTFLWVSESGEEELDDPMRDLDDYGVVSGDTLKLVVD